MFLSAGIINRALLEAKLSPYYDSLYATVFAKISTYKRSITRGKPLFFGRNMIVFYTLAGLVIGVLSVVAGYYLWQLHLQKQRIKFAQQQSLEEQQAKRKEVNNSIQILARGTLQNQLTITEASIRISALLDSLSVPDAVRAEYQAFYLLAAKTSHIPIKDKWKALSKKEKFEFDRERESLEFEHADSITLAAKGILGKTF